MLTRSPATIPWLSAPTVTAASPVSTPARAWIPGPRARTASTRSRAARTARSASSSDVDRRAPHRHDRVADELLDRAAVAADHLAGEVEVAAERVADVLGVALLGEGREPDEVGEQHRDETSLGDRTRGDGRTGDGDGRRRRERRCRSRRRSVRSDGWRPRRPGRRPAGASRRRHRTSCRPRSRSRSSSSAIAWSLVSPRWPPSVSDAVASRSTSVTRRATSTRVPVARRALARFGLRRVHVIVHHRKARLSCSRSPGRSAAWPAAGERPADDPPQADDERCLRDDHERLGPLEAARPAGRRQVATVEDPGVRAR